MTFERAGDRPVREGANQYVRTLMDEAGCSIRATEFVVGALDDEGYALTRQPQRGRRHAFGEAAWIAWRFGPRPRWRRFWACFRAQYELSSRQMRREADRG